MLPQGRKDARLADLVASEDSSGVLQEVQLLCRDMFPDFALSGLQSVFIDITRLFRGAYPGYRACNTRFHDLAHTCDCFLAMARLFHGATACGVRWHPRDLYLALIAALMHDTGYIQEQGDTATGTGARYTRQHIERSIAFMRGYFHKNGLKRHDCELCGLYLRSTGLDVTDVSIKELPFPDSQHRLLGMMLAAADLLGQMASRTYLEKLPYLYLEFQEGGIPGFSSAYDLLSKTVGFYHNTRKRLENELGGVDRYLPPHFRKRWGINRDLYREAIEAHLAHLRNTILPAGKDYRRYLRRGEDFSRLAGRC
jgi:hypothetical protein